MSRNVALGGILTALCVVLTYLGAYLPTGRLGMYALASVTIAVAVVELGIKFGAVAYAASAILVFLFTGSINALLLFALFFGSYPLLKYYIERQRSAVSEMILKFVAFNLAAMLFFVIYKLLLGISPVNLSILPLWTVISFIAGAQLVFLIYDYILSRLIGYYINRAKSFLKR